MIKWIPDGETTEKKLKIAESIAPKWRDVAEMIDIENAQIANIQNPGSGTTPEQCLREVFSVWQKDGNSDYPFSWDGLILLLVDIEHSILAEQLREALASQRSTVCSNLHQQTRKNKENDTGTDTYYSATV